MMKTTILLLALVFAFGVASCAKKPATDAGAETAATDGVNAADLAADLSDSDAGKAMGLETVHYAYDSSLLDESSKATLNSNAQILKEKTSLKIQIEGHCDERGGIQYNIALGERRANAAKAFITDKGISSDRITIISYGKEKPIDPGHTEESFSKNRRANFRITEK